MALRELADWAETILCNSAPLPHCGDKGEWDNIIAAWRDAKHALRYDPNKGKNIELQLPCPVDSQTPILPAT
jgi:hypothetical protein